MGFIISGIQQMGIGIPNVYEAWEWYRKALGFDVPVFDDPGVANRMLPYTGGVPQSRHAVLAINMQGGGGLEIWQYTSRKPQAPEFMPQMGDLGIMAVKIKTMDADKAFSTLVNSKVTLIGGVRKTPEGIKAFMLKDPYGNLIQVEECRFQFMNSEALNGGVVGAIIGVSNMEASIAFYKEILGYDQVVYDVTGTQADFVGVEGGTQKFRRVLLSHQKPRVGAFSRIFGSTRIELVQVLDRAPKQIFENRFWGDLGFIHLCFDIQGMSDLRKHCSDKGHPFTVDSNPETKDGVKGTFDMGEAAGHFSYIEDPDGTLIEFVETHKLPIVKKLGWFMDLRKRPPEKPLPDWMLKTLKWNRKKQ